MNKTILALYPFSQSSKEDETTGVCYEYKNGLKVISNWHLVINGHWIDLHIRLPKAWQFSINYDLYTKQILFTRYFGGNLNRISEFSGRKYHFSVIDTPLTTKVGYYLFYHKDAGWLEVDAEGIDYEQLTAYEKACSHEFYTFKDNEQSIIAYVFGSGHIRVLHWLPKGLNRLFSTTEKWIDITFDKPIGKEVDSWKGGLTGLYHGFKNTLEDSWKDFKETRLKYF